MVGDISQTERNEAAAHENANHRFRIRQEDRTTDTSKRKGKEELTADGLRPSIAYYATVSASPLAFGAMIMT